MTFPKISFLITADICKPTALIPLSSHRYSHPARQRDFGTSAINRLLFHEARPSTKSQNSKKGAGRKHTRHNGEDVNHSDFYFN